MDDIFVLLCLGTKEEINMKPMASKRVPQPNSLLSGFAGSAAPSSDEESDDSNIERASKKERTLKRKAKLEGNRLVSTLIVPKR
jgi:hypothetical protein